MTTKKIGFIGLGLMGQPMARNLNAAGYELVIYNRSRTAVDELMSKSVVSASSPAEVAARTSTIILMLTDTRVVESVLLGSEGVFTKFGSGKLIVDMGTTSVPATRKLAELATAAGGDYLDAPVSGGQVGAIDGTLTIMAGGSDSAFAQAKPMLSVLGKHITHVGGAGAGQVAKIANQVIVGLTIGAVAEALALAKSAGIDPEKVRQALAGGFAASRILDIHGKRMTEGNFTPGGRAKTQLKDMILAEELAAGHGIDLPATKTNRELYEQLVGAGDGDLDHSALFHLFDPALRS